MRIANRPEGHRTGCVKLEADRELLDARKKFPSPDPTQSTSYAALSSAYVEPTPIPALVRKPGSSTLILVTTRPLPKGGLFQR